MNNPKLKSIFTALFLTTTAINSAYAEPNCQYENGQVSSQNHIRTPGFVTSGPSWMGWFEITNISDKPITVKMEFTDIDGNEYTPYSMTYQGHFYASNTPINLQHGAVLQPGQLGLIGIKDDATARVNVGKLSWSSDTCLAEAVIATMYNQYNAASEYDSGWALLNGGMAF